MTMHWIDWVLVATSVVVLTALSSYTLRYMRGVADFLAANRSAGRYLLTVAGSMSGMGAISAVAEFEAYYAAGFPPVWWVMMTLPVSAIIILTGWVYYRYRETRCLTLAQFFERRYSRNFRVYAGIITWVSGIVNFGIFPVVCARFMVYFCGLPERFDVLGFSMPTVAAIMIATIGVSFTLVSLGGQVTVMVTDCMQGIFVGIAVLILAFYLLGKFPFDTLEQALTTAPEGASMIHPYQTSRVKDFNAWFYVIGVFGMFYGYMSWQGSQAYQSSGLNPHEQKMGAIIGLWRNLPTRALVVLIAVCSFALLTLPQYGAEQQQVRAVLDTIDNETIRTQMTVPVAFSVMLPIGLKGLFVATMIFWEITTLDTYMHSWGSIFVQDVVLPFRKKPFTPQQHVRLLRYSILFVGLFAYAFSLLFRQTEYILMFFAITGAIISGAGAAIVGGLYWNRGTTGAAWTAMTIGWVLAVGRIVLQQIAPLFADVPVDERGSLLLAMDWINGINSQWIWFWIMVSCLVSYALVSLLVPHPPHDMDKMLHRGKYRVAIDHVETAIEKRTWYQKITGVDREFTFWDRVLANLLVIWNFGWFVVFVIGTIYNLIVDVPDRAWMRFWQVWTWLQMGIGAPVTIWFTWGSIRDTLRLFKRLDTLVRDAEDDGRVRDEAPGDVPGATMPK